MTVVTIVRMAQEEYFAVPWFYSYRALRNAIRSLFS